MASYPASKKNGIVSRSKDPVCWLAEAVKRRRGCLTLRELAKSIGISAATLARVEAGRMPSTPVYVKLCDWIARSDFDAYTCEPGCSYALGGQTWVMTERWDPAGRSQDGHNLLFRNKDARQIARWVHPDELQHLHRLGVVTVPT